MHRSRAARGSLWSRLTRGLLLLACCALATAPRALAQDGEANRAGLVIQFGEERVEARCVEFQAPEISGADLLKQSGLDAIVDPSSGLGITVCRIEGQGCEYPSQPCFCQCSGSGPCAYWNYFYRDPGSVEWTYAPLGALLHKVRPGSVDAWVWGNGQVAPAAELSFEAVCAASAPAAVSPTALTDGESAATAIAGPVAVVSPGPTTPAPRLTAEPEAAGQAATSYWLFGVMVLGLAVAGAVVWLRSRRG